LRFSLTSSKQFLETCTVKASVTVSFQAIVIYEISTQIATKYLPYFPHIVSSLLQDST
jgi:hypothetical protein